MPMTFPAFVAPGVTLEMLIAGGWLRDRLLGVKSKDLDLSVVVTGLQPGDDPFAVMCAALERDGFTIVATTPDKFTARGHMPKDHPTFPGVFADFVLARIDGPTADGRRPEFVTPAPDHKPDRDRRDFTVNAMMAPLDDPDAIIDDHGGIADLRAGVLRFVGDPMERIRDDALRIMRAFRFEITKGFTMTDETDVAVCSQESAALLEAISNERRADELERMLAHDQLATFDMLRRVPSWTREAMLSGRVRLGATLKAAPVRFIDSHGDPIDRTAQ